MPRIFITYRREDSSGYVGRLHERLSAAFGAKSVFMDLDDIKPGDNFADIISKAVGSCDILIVLIGKQWLTINDASGRRRIDDPQDFVRSEIATALNRNVRVIPVLVRKASMPLQEELPEPLASLARRQALELSDERWDFDVGQLIKALGGGSITRKIWRIWDPWRPKIAAFIGLVVFTILLAFYFTRGAVDDAEKFLGLVAKSDLHSAYVLTASAFQAQVSEESFADQVKRLGLLDNASATWTSREFKNNQATLSGSVTTKQRGTIPLSMTLVKEGDSWMVLSLRGPQVGVQTESSVRPLRSRSTQEEVKKTKSSANDLSKLLLSSSWCSYSYNKISGGTSTNRVQFFSNGTWGNTSRHEGYSSGDGGTMASQQDSGNGGRWRVMSGLLYMSSGGESELKLVELQVKQNSNGFPIIVADGVEYAQCQ